MKLLFACALVLGLAGCTLFKSAACDAQKAITPVLAGVVSSQLGCTHPDVIQALIDAQIAKTQLCTTANASLTKSAVAADLLCPIAIDAVMSGVIAQIPATAGCTGGPAADVVKAKLLEACKQIPL